MWGMCTPWQGCVRCEGGCDSVRVTGDGEGGRSGPP